MKFNATLAIVAASLALASPFAAQAQTDRQYDDMGKLMGDLYRGR